jgi:hypothetical protein
MYMANSVSACTVYVKLQYTSNDLKLFIVKIKLLLYKIADFVLIIWVYFDTRNGFQIGGTWYSLFFVAPEHWP